MRRSHFARIAVLTVLAAAAFGPAPAAAQQPVGFVHGFLADGGGWGMLPINLMDRFPIRATTPTLGWSDPLATQASRLQNELVNTGFTNPVLIGHSNGGLISRQTTRLMQTSGVMTIGTLHGGAPLAGNLGAVEWVAAVTFFSNYFASAYANWLLWGCWDCYSYDPWTWWITYIAASYDINMAYVGAAAFPITIGLGIYSENVRNDMVPWSGFLADLNSGGNLGREASEVPVRVGIGSSVWTNYGLMWNGIIPSYWGELTSLQYNAAYWSYLGFIFNSFFTYWDDPYFWDKQFAGWLFLDAAYVDWSIDPWWCQIIGAWAGYCTESDAIVPLWSQQFPGWGNVTNYTIYGPSHTQEKQSGEVYYATSYALQNNFGLPPRY